ncbi:MAG TPA: aminoglycoside 6'-N-acetyltransferase [Gemmatimonadaceae bacterium]
MRPVVPADAAAWIAMRRALWPDDETVGAEAQKYFDGTVRGLLHVLFAVDGAGRALGFAELNIRAYAEGAESERVAYLEGWYVVDDARRTGVGAALIRAAEDWGRAQGCTEFASDALLENEVSARAHTALGFREVERIRCFIKRI